MDKEMIETFSAAQSPFREVIDTARFFSGGNRSEILNSLKSAVLDSVSLITLTGDEGCGKSMICRMLEQELTEGYVLIFFHEMLESFEDVTRIIAQKMEITLADGIASGDVQKLMSEVGERLLHNNQKMLLIFDQAERIYLATLERIRKMLDMANQTEINLQILFSGNEGLLDNLKQLSVCNFQGAEERQITLEPLNSSSTYAYLNFCMKSQTEDEVFTLEASEKIFSLAAGNIRKTNFYAGESLKTLSSNSSFMVLLENVSNVEAKEQTQKWDFSFWQGQYSVHKKWLIPTGIALVAVLLFLVFWTGRKPTVHEKKSTAELKQITAEYHRIQKKELEIEKRANAVKATPQVVKHEKPKRKTTKTQKVAPPEVTHITIDKRTKIKSAVPENKKIAPASKTIQPKHAAPAKLAVSEHGQKQNVDRIFNERTAAAARWLVGRQNNQYTIQLMVLASDGAEDHLKRILAEKEYQDLADNLFILRKAASNSNILVFYGEYNTMAEARKARNNLPQFLLKHDPYAISIRGAVEKAIGG
jgi:type II secretory pathway predicted ATPase ExeA/septal ring-binding cell division protein DamX